MINFLYKPALNWALWSLLIRLTACLAIHEYSISAGFEGFYPLASGNDDVQYWEVADRILSGVTPDTIPNSYPLFLVALFQAFGQNLLIGKLASVVVGALTVYVSVILTCELCSDVGISHKARNTTARLVGLLITFYPSSFWYSTQLIRDLFIVFFGILNIYCSILCLKRNKKIFWFLWIATFLATNSLRVYAAAGLLLTLFVYLIFNWKTTIQRKVLVVILALVIGAVVPYALGLGVFGLNRILPSLNVEEASRQRELVYSKGGSSAGVTVDYSNPISFIFTYGQSFLTAMIGPLPWQVRSVVTMVALPEALAVWFLCFKLWQSRFKKAATGSIHNEENFLLLSSLIQVGIVAFFSDNIGANTRLRLLSWTCLIIYASVVFAKRRAASKIRSLSYT
jgi:hypothetical protein